MVRSILEAYRKAYGGLSREVWLLSVAIFVNRFGTMVLPFLTLYLTTKLGFTEFSAGQILSVYGLGAIAGAYMGGKLTRKVGAIRLQIVLLCLAACMFLVLPFCTTWNSLAIGIFFQSLFSEGVRPPNATAISDFSTPETLSRAYALQRTAINLGFSFGPVIGGLLTTVGFHWLFIVDAITTFGCAVCLFSFFGFSHQSRTTDSSLLKSGKTSNNESTVGPWGDIPFLGFLGLILMTAIVFFQFHATYPLYLKQHYQLNEVMIGLMYAVNTVIVVAFEMLLVDRAKTWPVLLTIGWGCFFVGVGFGVLPWSSGIWLCVLSMVILTVGEMLSAPLASGWVATRSANKDVGAYMGWYTMTWSVAAVVGPAIGTWIYERDKAQVWHWAMVMAFVVLAGFYAFDRAMAKATNSDAVHPNDYAGTSPVERAEGESAE